MPSSTISNTILDPNGVAIANVPVTVRLMPTGGFRVDTFTEVARVVEATSNASGFWSLALERNSNITPGTTSTWYEVTETIPNADGGTRTWTIQVGASDQTVLASLVTPAQPQPTVVPPGVTYISQASGDARYQAVGSLGSGTPATETPDAAGTAGVATSASRSDHVHPITAGTPVDTGDANAEGAGTGFARDTHVHKGVVANDAWTTWTPTWVNFTVGSATISAKYVRVGRTIHYRLRVTLSGSTMGTDPTFTLPVTPAASYASSATQGDTLGTVRIIDAGTADFSGQVFYTTSGVASPKVGTAGGTYTSFAGINVGAPMTWANTDVLMADGTYEAAS